MISNHLVELLLRRDEEAGCFLAWMRLSCQFRFALAQVGLACEKGYREHLQHYLIKDIFWYW